MKFKVYRDYFEGELIPRWYVVSFKKGQLDWNKTTVYFLVQDPEIFDEVEQYQTDSQSLSVTSAELVRHVDDPRKIGIYLPALRQRAVDAGYDYWETEHLFIRAGDIHEIMQMNPF